MEQLVLIIMTVYMDREHFQLEMGLRPATDLMYAAEQLPDYAIPLPKTWGGHETANLFPVSFISRNVQIWARTLW